MRFLSLFLIGLTAAVSAGAEPFNVYLLYNDDPSTSIVVNFAVDGEWDAVPDPEVRFDTQSRGGDAAAYANSATGSKSFIPELPVDRTLNAVSLTRLQPNTTYYFVAGNADGFTEERSFRTIPAGDEPIRFVTGGDMNVTPLAKRLLAIAGKQDPLFCAIGGDIAYVNGRIWEFRKWDRWFENYDENLRTPDGHMVPMLVGIGNHETNNFESDNPAVMAPFYTAFFGKVQSDSMTYFTRQFGKNFLFILLDTSHVVPHAGEQTRWLAETLAANQEIPYRFALYHVPLYPSHRAHEGEGSRLGRVHWEPLFSAYNLTTGFENHDHTLKRSKLLKNGEPAEDGVLYIGDGSFGVNPRMVDAELRPYLEVQQGIGHVWVADVSTDQVVYRALGEDGATLDEYSHSPNK